MSPITDIHTAVKDENIHTVFSMIKRNKKCVHHRDKWYQTPMHIAAEKGNLGIVTLLYKYGADINARDETDFIPLHRASAGGHLEVVRFLIENGADVKIDFKAQTGLSALHKASRYGHLPVVIYLVEEANADKNNRTWGGYTPADIAKIYGKVEVYNYLI